MYISNPPPPRPCAAGILHPPPLVYAPPILRRVFLGMGGGCIKFGPPSPCNQSAKGGEKASCGEMVVHLEGPARHLDVSRQKLSPNCLERFLTRNYPRMNCLLQCLPECLSPTREGIFPLSKITLRGEGNCETSERQKLSCGNFVPRHQDVGVFGESVSSLPP